MAGGRSESALLRSAKRNTSLASASLSPLFLSRSGGGFLLVCSLLNLSEMSDNSSIASTKCRTLSKRGFFCHEEETELATFDASSESLLTSFSTPARARMLSFLKKSIRCCSFIPERATKADKSPIDMVTTLARFNCR